MELVAKHKTCPRCHKEFLCNPPDIAHCQCASAKLTPEEREYVTAQNRANGITDCLCINCLLEMKQEFGENED
ncbi:cysteine-rich CWC family protein [Flammeovirgaceae bacterium SG7u.111]|nr:cysteine-rich CWC family protein [Flammeovirgaceae bacterium SG7u.132]WPO37703.1 cysteine-rich CWC family protein [Flammeovirgaceae bacterium SG7u.111]